jgi:outer membrane protein insertion porin family
MDVAADQTGQHKMLGRRAVRAALLSVFLGTTTLCAGMVGPAFAQSFTFNAVDVQGNERVDAPTIIAFAGIGRGETLSAADLNDAYQRVLGSGLFEEVDFVPSGSTLIIRVREYPMINIVNFEGNERLKDEQLAELVQSQSRRAYSPAQAEADAALITEAYAAQSRFAATVTPRIIRRDGNRVDLVFEISEGRVVEVERIGFVGNRAYSDRRLRQVLGTKQAGIFRQIIGSDTFQPQRLEFDRQLLRDFYLSRGYVDVEVLSATGEVTRERDAVFVTYTIREGQQFRIAGVSTVSEVPEADAEEFAAQMRVRSGVVYSPSIIENTIARMENLALRKGLNFVRIDPRITRNERDGTLEIEFAIVRGERVFVERIDIEGNTTTLDEVIRRQFRTVEGDPLNAREVRRSAERIRALGFFSDAVVETEPGSGPDQVVVNVDVEEQPTGSLSFGVSYGVSAGVGLNIGFAESNFLGRGQSLGVTVSQGTDNTTGGINFVEPSFLGRDLRFSFDLFYNETESQNSDYNTRAGGIRTGLGFPIGENTRLDLRYRLSRDRITDVPAESSAILQADEAAGAKVTSAIGYSISYDSRTTGLNPLGGVLLRFGQDFAGVGGDVEYVSTTALALAERRILNEEVTLRAIVEGGALAMLDGESRVTDRFFGNGKVRGFEGNGYGPRDLSAPNRDALGGNLFAAVRLEAEFPVGLPEEYGIRGGVFLDAGSVWSLDNVDGGVDGTGWIWSTTRSSCARRSGFRCSGPRPSVPCGSTCRRPCRKRTTTRNRTST